jgi:glutamate--cysteine ligase catalytic subunit
MVVFRDKVQIDDMESTAHFENIQSTNWNSVRFKVFNI